MRVLPAADTALLLEAADLDEAMRLLPALVAARLPGVTELVPAARTVLVRFDPTLVDARALSERLLAVAPEESRAAGLGSVVIPVRYDGEDLAEVAQVLGVSEDELVARHQAATWTVAFTGFAPGFGYLVGDDPLFDVPRRPSPRTRIPAGSVALAGRFSGVYPKESPGGWQLIGRTDAQMWDLDRDPPALLAPGTAVRFERVDRELAAPAAPQRDAVTAAHAVEVVRPGVQLLVQDLGRPGLAAQGVSASGAADRGALREANRAVGNPPGTAGLELAGGGAVLRFRGPAVAALAGAHADASLETPHGPHAVEPERAVAVDDGDELRIGGLRDGLRTMIAIRGGIALEPVLGSLATDTLAGLGPAPLAAGDALPLHGPAGGTAAVERTRAPRIRLPRPGDVVELGIVLGPRTDWFADDALAALVEQEWLVTPRSDRVGVRLEGATPLERSREGELESEGAVTGAIQVPPDGQPVLFLPDHPLTGGYPIIGAVVDRDLDLAGQLPPGARIRFRIAAPPH
ncbi:MULTISPECIES: urea amidolyase family protein [unclassified Agrococcus]|uniref:5-oxoprolinase subunit B/C family protein n=1 Tax=unclassified Agrococcus TaxID=2615065 RepID=UPI001FF1370C|nr:MULTISPECIES: urea amidolyase family protein [unclassified Agrococcus]MDR7234654.1 KipI family sensor histidine kinase inhibitor [Agrococcus sp. BE272]UOW00476.1 urea amidolyase family protein [Agrococcus sp. SCSIO52902]